MADNIKEYTSPVDSLRPDNTGTEATVQAAYRLGRFYNETAQAKDRSMEMMGRDLGSGIAAAGEAAVTYMSNQEISHGDPAFNGIWATKTQQWNDMVKGNPNDPTIVQKFNEGLEPDLDKFVNSFHTDRGRQWAQDSVDRLRSHFRDLQNTDMQIRAGAAFDYNRDTTMNIVAANLHDDPGGLDFANGTVDSTRAANQAAYPNLDVQHAAAMDKLALEQKQSYFKAAFMGWLKKDPSGVQAQKLLNDPKYDVLMPADSGGKEPFQKAIETIQKENVAQQKAAIELQNLKEKQAADSKTYNYLQDAASTNPKYKPTDMMADPVYKNRPDLLETGVKAYKNVQEFLLHGETADPRLSQQTSLNLLGRMALPDGDPMKLTDPNDITKAYADKQLTKTDYDFAMTHYNKMIGEPGFKDLHQTADTYFKNYAMTIDPSMAAVGGTGSKSAEGQRQLARATNDFWNQVKAEQAQGKSPSEIQNDLLNQNSANFFFRPSNLNQYISPYDAAHPKPDLFATEQDTAYIERSRRYIGHFESSMNYSKVVSTGDGDSVYGAYGIKGSNIPAWTERWLGKALTPEQFLQDPRAQDTVFAKQFAEYTRLYGPEGAARAWYAGEKRMNNLSATDRFKRVTVQQYGEGFMQGIGGASSLNTIKSSDLPEISDPAEASKLPSGTRFRIKGGNFDGQMGVVP